jgi:hypothetical protein
MTVSACGVTFSDWVSLPMEGQYSDTFIFRIDSQACLPPWVYVPLLKRIAAKVLPKRSCASLWIQVDGPGQWFAVAIHNALKGLRMPFIVTQKGEVPTYEKFSLPPVLSYSPMKRPSEVNQKLPSLTPDELRCLQALGRMMKGDVDEVASLSGFTPNVVTGVLSSLHERRMVQYKTGMRILRKRTLPVQPDPVPLWHSTRAGSSAALRSWGVPRGIPFTDRKEKNTAQIGYKHRHIARLFPTWLNAALPQAEIWAGWNEVRIPGTPVIPDGVAWGKLQGHEVLFWLEVGDAHKSRKDIKATTRKRLKAALRYCERTGMWLVYVQLSPPWVHQAMAIAHVNLPAWATVIHGKPAQFGNLPTIEWGKVNS